MTEQDSRYPTCRHIKANGLRCESPALNGESFCYYHAGLHANHPAPLTAHKVVSDMGKEILEGIRQGGEDPYAIARVYPRQNEYNFPPLEDAESVQLAASMLFHAISQGQIHPPRARTLIQALSVANHSLRLRRLAPPADPANLVRAVDRTPEGVAIAPADDAPLSSRSPGSPASGLGSLGWSAAEGSASPTAEPAPEPESNDELTSNHNQ